MFSGATPSGSTPCIRGNRGPEGHSIAGCPWLVEHHLANPDALDCRWVSPIQGTAPHGSLVAGRLRRWGGCRGRRKCGRCVVPVLKRMPQDFQMLAIEVEPAAKGPPTMLGGDFRSGGRPTAGPWPSRCSASGPIAKSFFRRRRTSIIPTRPRRNSSPGWWSGTISSRKSGSASSKGRSSTSRSARCGHGSRKPRPRQRVGNGTSFVFSLVGPVAARLHIQRKRPVRETLTPLKTPWGIPFHQPRRG